MDTCFNCGAAVRPGAKFCTSCGTRLIDNPAPVSSEASSDSETQVAAPAVVPATSPKPAADHEDDSNESSPFASWKHASSGWNTPRAASPADRFGAALDAQDSSREEKRSTSADGWRAPSTQDTDEEDRFASWAAAYRPAGSADSADTGTTAPQDDTGETGTASEESVTIAPAKTVERADTLTDAAGAPDEIGHPSDDGTSVQPLAAGEPDSGIVAGSTTTAFDARERASSLIDELRTLIWQIGLTGKTDGDETLAKIVLAGARGMTGDFSDVRTALDVARDRPRDLDAMESLVTKADRIQELLDSHSRLLEAIDEAIDELR